MCSHLVLCHADCLISCSLAVHRRRSGCNSGGRMASPEGWSVSSDVGYGEGCLQPTRDLVSVVVISPSGVRGRAPADNGFWRILKATERSFFQRSIFRWGGGGGIGGVFIPHWLKMTPTLVTENFCLGPPSPDPSRPT